MNYISKQLGLLNSVLNRKNLNLNEIRNIINFLNDMPIITYEDYLNTLLYPSTYKDSRIPTNIPTPTCTFSLTWHQSFQAGAGGTILCYLNPWFLNIDCAGVSYPYNFLWTNNRWYKYKTFLKGQSNFLFYRHAGLTGESEMDINTLPTPYEIGHKISNVYSKYRLVSGELKVIPYQNILNAKGVIGGGILIGGPNNIGAKYYNTQDYDANYNPNATFYNSALTDLVKFTDFNNIRRLPYSKEVNVYEGLRMLYFPAGKEYEDFTNIYDGKGTKLIPNEVRTQTNPEIVVDQEYVRTNFAWLFYMQNGQPNTTRVMASLTCNYECIPKAEYLSYFEMKKCYSAVTESQKKMIYDTVKNNIIQAIPNPFIELIK